MNIDELREEYHTRDFANAKCIASEMESRISNGIWDFPVGNFYLSRDIVIEKPSVLWLRGSNRTFREHNNDTTVFFSDKNITFFRLLGWDIQMTGGVFAFDFIKEIENPTAILIGGPEYKTTKNIRIRDVSFTGNRRYIENKENVGGYGIRLNTDAEVSQSDAFGINDIVAENIYFEHLNKALYIPKKKTPSVWFNTLALRGRVENCKQGIVAETGSIIDVQLVCQDNPVLRETEKDLYYHVLDASLVTHDIVTHDMGGRDFDPIHLRRHRSDRHIYSVNPTNIAVGNSLLYYNETALPNNNRNTVVKDPNYLAISSKTANANVITNQVAGSGLLAGFSYRGYIEPEPVNLSPVSELAVIDTEFQTVSIPTKKGEILDISFDCKLTGRLGRLRITGIETEIDELYTSKNWENRNYEVRSTGSVIELKLFRIAGVTSVFEGNTKVAWKDTLIRGGNYRIEIAEGENQYAFGYYAEIGEDYLDDVPKLRKLMQAQKKDLQITKAAYRGMTFYGDAMKGKDFTVKTTFLGTREDSIEARNLKAMRVWHKNNLSPSTLPESPEVKIQNLDFLQRANTREDNGHVVNHPMGFAEIVIPMQIPGKIRRVVTALSDSLPQKLQLALYSNAEILDSVIIENELGRNSTIDLLSEYWGGRHKQTTHIMLRLIGTQEIGRLIGITDVMVTTNMNSYCNFVTMADLQKKIAEMELKIKKLTK